MSQSLSPAHAHGPSFRNNQGLLMAVVAAAASLLTAIVMEGRRAGPQAAPLAAVHRASATQAAAWVPPAAHITRGTAQVPGSAAAEAEGAPGAGDFPLQEPAPTF